ncbi:MAG: flagellar hook-basal body complex protein [Pseudomonadota bacterium]
MDKAIGPVLLAGQRVQHQRVDIVANNIANASTSGFRAQMSIASEHVMQRAGPSVSMPRLATALTDARPGVLTMTGVPLDFAIEGPGFFLIGLADGRQALTRAGSFIRRGDGTLGTPDGAALLGEGGGPIALPEGGGPIVLARDGTLSSGGAIIGRVGVVAEDAAGQRLAGARFALDGPAEPAEGAGLRQGVLESSNVSPVQALAELIDASRRYEMFQSMVEEDDRRIRNVIETFSRQT